MTLDEAIAISDEIGKGDTERAANNRWLAEKLRILKWVEDCHIIDEARRAREEMHGWQADWRKVSDENAKLRELVRDMWACIDHGAGWNCDACPRHEKCRDETGKYGGGIFELECRMSDLGIEVE